MAVYKLHLAIGDRDEEYTDLDQVSAVVVQLIDSMGNATRSEIELADATYSFPHDPPGTPRREGLMLLVRHRDGSESTPFAAVENLDMDTFISHSRRRPDKMLDTDTGIMMDLKNLN